MSKAAGLESSPTEPRSRWLHVVLGVHQPGAARALVPGFLLAAGVMLAALPLADFGGRALLRWQGVDPAGRSSPLSGVLVAIVLGALLRNTLPLPAMFQPGIQFCVTKILRLGIILIGLKLSLLDVLRLGAWGLPIVGVTIAAGLLLVAGLNRALGLPGVLGTLMAAGTSICGVTAIVSTAAAIRAPQRETAYAVANIALFGLLAMVCYPHLAPLLLQSPEQIGLFFGTAIHDTSQVVGAALTYKELHHDDAAFKAATVTKLTRNLFLVVVVPLVAYWHARGGRERGEASGRVAFGKLIPLFVLGFVLMTVIRTIGDATAANGGRAYGLLDPATWAGLTNALAETWGARYALGIAMAAVGLGTSFATFRGVGLRPMLVGLGGAVGVGVVGLAMSWLLGRHVHL